MPTATATKPARFTSIIRDVSGRSVLKIRVEHSSGDVDLDLYLVEILPADTTSEYGLTKIHGAERLEERYEVNISGQRTPNCTCPGWKYRKACRHVSALLACRKRGQI